MADKTSRGKCPQCLPDGGAIFKHGYDKLEGMADWGPVRQCMNCGYAVPARRVKPSGKPTPSQQRAVEYLTGAFGGTHKVTMIGRKVWLEMENDARKWYDGTIAYGIIAVNGRYQIKLCRVCGEIVIKDCFDVKVYLADPNRREQATTA
jgi:hypothetical protein